MYGEGLREWDGQGAKEKKGEGADQERESVCVCEGESAREEKQ